MKKKTLLFIYVLFGTILCKAQLTTPPNGGNKKAAVSERIGITDVSVHYNRPGVKGREGKIWGQLVHYGYIDQGFGTSKSAPWRAGANECTTISFSTDVKVEGQELPAGKYALFLALQPNEAEVIFNKGSKNWGSYFYEPKDDVLKVKVKSQALGESVEWLTYEFSDQTENSATISMTWEKLKVPFKVEVDLVNTQIASFRKELTSDIGFRPDPWVQAARFCAQSKTNLDEGLKWADYAISGPFIGQKSFQTLSTKAEVLGALNRTAESEALMKEAMPLGSVDDVHQYARTLLRQGKKAEALAVFQSNAKKFPNVYTTNVGLARGYSGTGDYKNALKYAKAALPQAPDKPNKENVERIIGKLEKGEDINQ
jgi:tetratricopeptide (TPR) repeat protein